MEMSKTIDEYLQKNLEWSKELNTLRELLLSTELKETVKWGFPVYTLDGKNVIGLGAFKGYAGIWFFQGSFLKDEMKVLINAQQGKTRGMRQWRFNSADNIDEENVLAYIHEAILNQAAGKEIKPERKKPIEIPEELLAAIKEDTDLKESFKALSKSYQREYAEYIAEAKKQETRLRRVDKIIPMILVGQGLNDKYK
ncbi:MAG: YdeI/OmpD-associated family protein [Cyclobacteriaceae bacterium]